MEAIRDFFTKGRLISQEERDKRLHIANATISVYTLDIEFFKSQLSLIMENRGYEVKWVENGQFDANTSIRKDNELALKSLISLYNEITQVGAKKYELHFHTADKICGYCDQMIYYRWT